MEERNFLQRLRDADEDAKKVYALAISCVVMSLVVFVWLTWFNDFDAIARGTRDTELPPDSGGFSFFQSLKSMGAAAGESLGGFLGGPKEYLIQPEN